MAKRVPERIYGNGWWAEAVGSGTLPGGGITFVWLLSGAEKIDPTKPVVVTKKVGQRERRYQHPTIQQSVSKTPNMVGGKDEMPDVVYVELYPEDDRAVTKLLTAATDWDSEDFDTDYYLYDATTDVMAARWQTRARGGARNKAIIAAEMAVQDILEKWGRAPFQSGEPVSVPEYGPKDPSGYDSEKSITAGEWARLVFPTSFEGVTQPSESGRPLSRLGRRPAARR